MIFGLRYTRGTADPFTITILKTMKNEKLQIDFWVEVHAGDSWSLHDHHPKNHEKWKISDDFWVEVHAGDSWSLHDHHPENNKKMKNFSNDFWVEVHAGYNWSLHDHQPKNHEEILKTMKTEKFRMIFGLRYKADPTITMKTIFQMIFGLRYTRGQLIPSRSPS